MINKALPSFADGPGRNGPRFFDNQILTVGRLLSEDLSAW